MNALLLSFVGERCFVCGSDRVVEAEIGPIEAYECEDCEVICSIDDTVVVGRGSTVAWLDSDRSVVSFLIQLATVRRNLEVEYE